REGITAMNIGVDSLGSVGWAISAVALLLWAAYACGRPVAAAGGRDVRQPLECEGLRIAVGLNLLGAIGITLGMLRLLGGARAIWLLAALGLVAGVLV